MNPKDTTEYIQLKASALTVLEYQRLYSDALEGYRDGSASISECRDYGRKLDAALSILWDITHDKELV